MRKYIRHPSDIPIDFDIDDIKIHDREFLNDISFGGLSFCSKTRLKAGVVITIKISFVKPAFECRATVKWCRKHGDFYDVGVAFSDKEDAYRTRMIEQICHIEHYKREVFEKEGRDLSGEEAAVEWIQRFAAKFSKFKIEK